MKTSVAGTLKPLVTAIAACLVGGCAAWPGSSLPTAAEVHENAKDMLPEKDGCAASTDEAVRCARYLSVVLSDIESDTGKWDTAYSLGSVAAGTLAAIYLKSDTDRTQALEDLAVAVAALAGIRGVLKPDDRRRIAREGRKAVDCMISAAEGIKTYAEEAKQDKDGENNAKSAAVLTHAAQKRLDAAKSDLEAETLKQTNVGSKTVDNEVQFTAAQTGVSNARNEVSHAEAALASARATQSVAEAQASAAPFTRLRATIDREFAITETLKKGSAPQALRQGDGAASSQGGAATAQDLNRFASGILLQRQLLDVETAKDKANKSAEVAAALLPKTLAFGVYEVLNHVRSSIADLASAPENIAKTQRDTVNGLIADLKAKTDAVQDAGKKLEGGSETTPVTEEQRTPQTQDVVDTTQTPAKRKIVTVFNQCVATAS